MNPSNPLRTPVAFVLLRPFSSPGSGGDPDARCLGVFDTERDWWTVPCCEVPEGSSLASCVTNCVQERIGLEPGSDFQVCEDRAEGLDLKPLSDARFPDCTLHFLEVRLLNESANRRIETVDGLRWLQWLEIESGIANDDRAIDSSLFALMRLANLGYVPKK